MESEGWMWGRSRRRFTRHSSGNLVVQFVAGHGMGFGRILTARRSSVDLIEGRELPKCQSNVSGRLRS
jgi:hypothetical protein